MPHCFMNYFILLIMNTYLMKNFNNFALQDFIKCNLIFFINNACNEEINLNYKMNVLKEVTSRKAVRAVKAVSKRRTYYSYCRN